MPDFDRAELLELLGRLGAPDDADVLAAARALHGKVSEAGLTWDTLLQLEAILGVPLLEAYGMTEASHQIASNPLPPSPREAGSVGRGIGTVPTLPSTT